MLEKLEARQQRLNLSLRALAIELSVSPTLLSLVLNRKRRPSKKLRLIIQRWGAAKGYANSEFGSTR